MTAAMQNHSTKPSIAYPHHLPTSVIPTSHTTRIAIPLTVFQYNKYMSPYLHIIYLSFTKRPIRLHAASRKVAHKCNS